MSSRKDKGVGGGGRRYGGTVARDNVVAEADWFVYDIRDVLAALEDGPK